MSATLKTLTLGCKVNQYETEYVREGLLGIGYRDAEGDDQADLCVVNTCTVTSEGDAKSRQAIRRLARENPGARIVVMGCYAARAPREVGSLPGVAEVVTDRRKLPELLGRLGVFDIPTGISRFGDRRRAYVKAQDGCLMQCSYCIIPQARPGMSTRPATHILAEVRRLVENGYREIVLTGVHLGHYGVDGNWCKPKSRWTRLSHLVCRIAQIDGNFRIRLSSIEATEATRELLQVMSDRPERICPHLHLCLQSGSDAVLRRMKRRWGVQRLIDCCQTVRETLDHPALTTDVIVGFPGETEEDFEKTCQAVQRIGFSKVHIFRFSPRLGTPAAQMPNQVSKRVKQLRSKRMKVIAEEARDHYLRSLTGRRLRVLVESPANHAPGRLIGTSCRYAPVELAGDERLCGQLLDVVAGPVVEGRVQAVEDSAIEDSTPRVIS